MAKQAGMGDRLLVAGYDLSGDIGSLGRIGGGLTPLEVTGIDKSGPERVGGLRDGSLDFTAWFNPATDRAHERFSALPTTDVIMTYLRGTTLGKPGAGIVAKQVNYDGTRGADGSFSFAVQALANGYSVDWGVQLTAGLRTDTEATDGTGVDGGAATSFGLQAFLHVTAFEGDDITIKLQSSSDDDPDGEGDEYADVTGGGFTQVTAGPTSERIQTARDLSVERYLRVVTTTSAGFDSCTFNVVVCRNAAATVF